MTDKPAGAGHTRRDVETFWALGLFQVILSIPVFIGTIYVEELFPALVNVAAAGATFLVGALMIWRAEWIRRRLK